MALLRPPQHHLEKKTAHASEKDRPDILKRRQAWFENQLDLDPEKRDAVLRDAKPLVEGALTQAGCHAYAWTADPHNPGRVFVIEEWESEAPFAAHLAGDWYRGMLKHMQGAGIRGAVTRKHRVSLSEPVYDATGRPRADFVSAA